jgi:hypothetical protein
VNKLSEDGGRGRKQGRFAKAKTASHHEEFLSISYNSDTAVSRAKQPKNESGDRQEPGVE